MVTSPPTARRWDVAPLILVGVTLGLVGSRWETVTGAALSLAGFVLLLAGLARWTLRGRRRAEAPDRRPVTAGV